MDTNLDTKRQGHGPGGGLEGAPPEDLPMVEVRPLGCVRRWSPDPSSASSSVVAESSVQTPLRGDPHKRTSVWQRSVRVPTVPGCPIWEKGQVAASGSATRGLSLVSGAGAMSEDPNSVALEQSLAHQKSPTGRVGG